MNKYRFLQTCKRLGHNPNEVADKVVEHLLGPDPYSYHLAVKTIAPGLSTCDADVLKSYFPDVKEAHESAMKRRKNKSL